MANQKITVLSQRNDLILRVNSTRRFFDYTIKSLSQLSDKVIIIEYFVDNIKTKHGDNRYLLIISEVDPTLLEEWKNDPLIDPRTGNTYKVITSSSRLQGALYTIREADPNSFPLLAKITKHTYTSKKDGKVKTYYELEGC